MNILTIIPARGGSKGIPRKNLRTLCGQPLIAYAVSTALASRHKPDVFVSTEDKEIAVIANKLGAKVLTRKLEHANDYATLDPVIFDGLQQASNMLEKQYDIVITLQPTSPLVKTESLDAAIDKLLQSPNLETIISAKEDRHLRWRKADKGFAPNYAKRLNRQFLPSEYTETGGFMITRAKLVTENNRIGANVDLALLSNGEEIDIDTQEDWASCEHLLQKKFVLFLVKGNSKIGLGHVYNTLLIANDLTKHKVEFLVDRTSKLAAEKIATNNYKVHLQASDNVLDDILRLRPNIVINDCLDTSAEFIQSLKANNITVINFEDLGPGAKHADLVVNAIYPEEEKLARHYFGPSFFLLRDEFLLTEPRPVEQTVKNVLLTFGGVDPNNLTRKVVSAVYDYCEENDIQLNVVTGFGYRSHDTLNAFKNIKIYQDSQSIANLMRNADLIFTSAGRTIYEVASQKTPSIVLAQNARELTHFFASSEFGFLNLGLGEELTEKDIGHAFFQLVDNHETRYEMSERMAKTDFSHGRAQTLKLINNFLEN